jgi:metal-dependent HD superfamily phosphatase/phosphodiesterase
MAKVIDREDLFLLGAVLNVEAHDRILRRVWRRAKGNNRHSLVHPILHIVYDDDANYRPMFADAYRDYLASLRHSPDCSL